MSMLRTDRKDTSPTALVPGVISVDRQIRVAGGLLPVGGSGLFPRRWMGDCG